MTLPGPNPLLATPRTDRRSYGPAVGRLAAAMGKPLMPWQQYAADVGLEVDQDGRFVYQQVIVTVPRQSGKTTLFGAVMVHRAAIVPRARVWFTQQSQKDAVDWMTNELWPLLSGFGPLAHLRRMAGSEHVRWEATQGLVRPFPPTPAGLHGKISDLVVIDECWAFDVYRGPALDQAIVPTTATRPNAQTWKLSTAGDSASGWWLGTVEQGRAAARHGRTDGVAYIEYGCPDTLDPTDPVSWPLYHPAYGRTIGTSSMQAALDMLGPDEFGRAYGNRWTQQTERVVPLDAWLACQRVDVPEPVAGQVAVAFDVAVDRSAAAISAAWRGEDGRAFVELADSRQGVAWLGDRLRELVDRWGPVAVGYDQAGPAVDIADSLERHGMVLQPLKAADYAAACAGLLDAIVAGAVHVRPHRDLDAAASAAARRTLGDRWCWGRRASAAPIAPLTSATCALWAYDHAPADIGTFRVW